MFECYLNKTCLIKCFYPVDYKRKMDTQQQRNVQVMCLYMCLKGNYHIGE